MATMTTSVLSSLTSGAPADALRFVQAAEVAA
jgi:hypothetical protein